MPNPGKRSHDTMNNGSVGSEKSLSQNKQQKINGSNGTSNKRSSDQQLPPKKRIKNGISATSPPQPKNTVAMLNELRQGLVYTLEGQSGPVHAPIFTMTVEVMQIYHNSCFV